MLSEKGSFQEHKMKLAAQVLLTEPYCIQGKFYHLSSLLIGILLRIGLT